MPSPAKWSKPGCRISRRNSATRFPAGIGANCCTGPSNGMPGKRLAEAEIYLDERAFAAAAPKPETV